MSHMEIGSDIELTREKVAKFLYMNDGNHTLPGFRSWNWLAPYWKVRYLELADELLEEVAEKPSDTVASITG